MATSHGAGRASPSLATLMAGTRSPIFSLPAFFRSNSWSLGSSPRAPVSPWPPSMSHPTPAHPRTRLGGEQFRLTLLFLLDLSVWKTELCSGQALNFGELQQAGHGGATPSLSLSLFSCFNLSRPSRIRWPTKAHTPSWDISLKSPYETSQSRSQSLAWDFPGFSLFVLNRLFSALFIELLLHCFSYKIIV